MPKTVFRLVVLLGLLGAGPAGAEVPWTFTNNTRYLALGDSLAAGYGALPTTQGYAYLLYQKGTYDSTVNTIFANAAVPGATSADVLTFQVPQAVNLFQPHVITLSVGGNDLLSLLGPVPPTPAQVGAVLSQFGGNLFGSLTQLCAIPDLRHIYVGNLYSIDGFPIETDAIIGAFNATLAGIVQVMNATCANRIRVADVHAAFSRPQEGLLLINRNGAGLFEVHPTNAGYRAMAAAFEAVHQ
jgi:lysophospholipase L1-like esterase